MYNRKNAFRTVVRCNRGKVLEIVWEDVGVKPNAEVHNSTKGS